MMCGDLTLSTSAYHKKVMCIINMVDSYLISSLVYLDIFNFPVLIAGDLF